MTKEFHTYLLLVDGKPAVFSIVAWDNIGINSHNTECEFTNAGPRMGMTGFGEDHIASICYEGQMETGDTIHIEGDDTPDMDPDMCGPYAKSFDVECLDHSVLYEECNS